jgi:radical SAM peptide maturase (CXXX-repeat target family)
LNIYGDYTLDRTSLDLDGILFTIKYILMNKTSDGPKDFSRIPELKKEFINKAIELREVFGKFVYEMLNQITGIPEGETIEDILVEDVNINTVYVEFKMIIVSKTKALLEYFDERIPDKDNAVYNIYPNEFFRIYNDSYNDGISKAYPELFENRQQNTVGKGKDSDVYVHNLTFQTSENCSLCCSYCYQFNKTPMRMSFETAKEFIDHLLNDDYGYINRYNSPAIIIEFIGGEPFLEINLTRRIYEYFLRRCYELNHPWFTMHRLSICSNGLAYFNKDVQDFFKDYYQNISFNISIDGNKELHDACRVQPNGEGSYDIDIAALNHYSTHYAAERNSKMTLAPSNIKYLYRSVIDFIDKGMYSINLNCVFEEGWTSETARIEYEQLKMLADYLIENNLDNLYIAIFRDRQEYVQNKSYDGNFCGGVGSMIAIRPNGDIYPCIRYMPTSVGDNVKDLKMGSVKDGFIGREENSEVLEMMDQITRRSQTDDICFECPLSNTCASCSALSHTVYGTPNKRTHFICIQSIAEHLANVYYWNNLILVHPEYDLSIRELVVPDEWALLVIDKEELENLKLLELAAIESKLEYSK